MGMTPPGLQAFGETYRGFSSGMSELLNTDLQKFTATCFGLYEMER